MVIEAAAMVGKATVRVPGGGGASGGFGAVCEGGGDGGGWVNGCGGWN